MVNMKNKRDIIFFIFLITVGLILFSLGSYFAIKKYIETKDYLVTEGKVIGYKEVKNDDDGSTYRIIYKYIVNQKEYEITTDYSTSVIPPINSTKKIKYDANNPDKATIPGFSINIFLIIFGFICMLFGLAPLTESDKTQNVIGSIIILIVTLIMGYVIYLVISNFIISIQLNGITINAILSLLPLLIIIIPLIVILAPSIKYSKNKKEWPNPKEHQEEYLEKYEEEVLSNPIYEFVSKIRGKFSGITSIIGSIIEIIFCIIIGNLLIKTLIDLINENIKDNLTAIIFFSAFIILLIYVIIRCSITIIKHFKNKKY